MDVEHARWSVRAKADDEVERGRRAQRLGVIEATFDPCLSMRLTRDSADFRLIDDLVQVLTP
jgi:hypothetical protein